MMTIEKIVNGSYKVTEKQRLLLKYKDEINEKISDAMEEVEKGYKYCPQCREYYKEKAFDTEYVKEIRTVCTYRDAGYGDDDKYEDKECTIRYSVCPMGHKNEEESHY